MSLRTLISGIAAGLLGWWGASFFESGSVATARVPGPVSRSLHVSADNAAGSLRVHRDFSGGSGAFARIARQIENLPAESLSEERAAIETWPPCALREFALALFDTWEPAGAEPEALDSAGSERPPNPVRDLAERIENGEPPEVGFSSNRENYGDHTLATWVENDPAAAMTAVLKMPPGERLDAVNVVAETMARYDPAGAMEFILKSGEQHLNLGSAEAFGYATIKNPSLPAMRRYFEQMTGPQQNSLLEGLALVVPDFQYNREYSQFDDSNRNPADPQHRSDLGLIACAALQTTQTGPGLESFVHNLVNFPLAVDEVQAWLASCESLTPVQQAAQEILAMEKIKSAAVTGSLEPLLQAPPAVFERAAPAVIENLATARRLPEALALFDRIHDVSARTDALQSLLPAWMATDPAAARAAFDAASFTALERERWQQQPAFLLHAKR